MNETALKNPNYKAMDDHHDYFDEILSPVPISVRRTINSIGCPRISHSSSFLHHFHSNPSCGLKGIEEGRENVEEGKMDTEHEEMYDSIVPETPMDSQNVEMIGGTNNVGVHQEVEVKLSKDGEKMNDSSEEVAEMWILNESADDGGMYDSIVPETPLESQDMDLIDRPDDIVKVNKEVMLEAEGKRVVGNRKMSGDDEEKVKIEVEEGIVDVENISVQIKQEHDLIDKVKKDEQEVTEGIMSLHGEEKEDKRGVLGKLEHDEKDKVIVKEEQNVGEKRVLLSEEEKEKIRSENEGRAVKQEVDETEEIKIKEEQVEANKKSSSNDVVDVEKYDFARFEEYVSEKSFNQNNNAKPVYVKKEVKVEQKSSRPPGLQDGDHPEESDWWLPLGDGIVVARSTARGRKLELNELVDVKFPTSWRSNIVRFETKRCGEIGTLPMDWGKCLSTFFNNGKLKIRGRCIYFPGNLVYHQDIMLSLRCYLHKSLFTETNHACWSLLPTLFKLMNLQPSKQAECTPEYLSAKKRSLNLQSQSEIASAIPPATKRRKGGSGPQITENTDEQSLSEATLNKIVGAAEVHCLEEKEPPGTVTSVLRPYQKQALYWMCRLESKEDAAHTLHPYYAEYQMHNGKAIYLNTFSGEATMKMPTATDSSRGGILADAMGLGKTVMTIALIHARRGRGIPDSQNYGQRIGSSRPRGGTLIICPMALLSQWKDELETHSEPDSLSISVHYGGNRTTDPRAMANHDVVLTTYGVLNAAYKSQKQHSIYHMVDWWRVVLDEAHTIKAWKTQTAQPVFTLSSHSRWCLTGTPLQNSLEDLYSLFNFLKVEPWCDWNNWRNTIQRPYEAGDPTGLTYVKAILKPLMLRRTKETRDNEGRLILELPPIEVGTIVCEQSEAEHDFYDALFRRSKVQFDELLAQGRVLHNYASILELLLRLRQCCNHPFLVMRRNDSQLWDLQKLARRFLESNTNSKSSTSQAYIEEVVEGIQHGDHIECPICLESADQPVVTPCGHKMCKECLLQSWRSSTEGTCPICRRKISKSELIIYPSDNCLQIDVEKNWKESSKVSRLLECLDQIRSTSKEKSIVFSQWTSFLDLLEIPLKRRGIGFLRFDGGLSQKQREKVLKEFNETKEKTVLLMSLKAGGVGLNLTTASHAFLMDPWWNPAVEEQAIMRIHRIGQKQTVKVRRFIVKDTVEERLQQVQARKQNMIAGALSDDDVRSARLEDLKMLFR